MVSFFNEMSRTWAIENDVIYLKDELFIHERIWVINKEMSSL